MNRHPELLGNWEERGVVGTRIEIERGRLTVLWQSGPVLETAYRTEEAEDGAVVLRLKHTGLRYRGAASDYAEVTALSFADGKLRFVETFPITGKSESTLEKTARSRFGDCEFADKEIFPQLRGEWATEDGRYRVKFAGNKMKFDNGETFAIHVLRSTSSSAASGVFRLVDEDPARHDLYHFCEVTYTGDRITAILPVLDARPLPVVFFRAEKATKQ